MKQQQQKPPTQRKERKGKVKLPANNPEEVHSAAPQAAVLSHKVHEMGISSIHNSWGLELAETLHMPNPGPGTHCAWVVSVMII